jgi:transcriptional repressor NrdR
MRCPKCDHQQDKVIDTRETRNGASIRRRRECLNCNHRFTTFEEIEIDHEELSVVKKNGLSQAYNPQKILNGLKRACEKRPIKIPVLVDIVDEITRQLIKENQQDVTTQKIGTLIMHHLKSLDSVAYVRYASVYREFEDLAAFVKEIDSLDPNQPNESTP